MDDDITKDELERMTQAFKQQILSDILKIDGFSEATTAAPNQTEEDTLTLDDLSQVIWQLRRRHAELVAESFGIDFDEIEYYVASPHVDKGKVVVLPPGSDFLGWEIPAVIVLNNEDAEAHPEIIEDKRPYREAFNDVTPVTLDRGP